MDIVVNFLYSPNNKIYCGNLVQSSDLVYGIISVWYEYLPVCINLILNDFDITVHIYAKWIQHSLVLHIPPKCICYDYNEWMESDTDPYEAIRDKGFL